MSLYKEFFYKISYGLDNVTDSQPNYFIIDIYANPDVYLNEYNVEDNNEDSAKKQIVLHLKSYIDLDKKVKQHWTFNTSLTESISKFFNEMKNEKDYDYTFAKKHLKLPVTQLSEIIDVVLKEYSNNKPNTQQMVKYLASNYQKQKGLIDEYLKKIYNSLDKSLIEKEYKLIKDNGAIGIDLPIKNKNEYFSVPFYLATPEYLSKLQLNRSLNQQLPEKKISPSRVKI